MVFQSYALYPHMTVRKNLAFSLRLAGMTKAQIDDRVDEAARILELGPYMDRKPANLSGGQRQRAAMGRAIVREPEVFLFDEPLSNLDAKLRSQMRLEIKRLQHRLKVTTIYVTHDQIEAMTLADIVVVMKDGRIAQQGTPLEVFNAPVNQFVAGFIGSPPMNFIAGRIEHGQFVAQGLTLSMVPGRFAALQDGHAVTLGVRPEDIVPDGHGVRPVNGVEFRAQIDLTEMLGNETLLFLRHQDIALTARMQQPRAVEDMEEMSFRLNIDRVHLFDAETGVTLASSPVALTNANT